MVHKSKKLIDLTAVKNQWIKELTAVCNHRIGRDEVLALRNDLLRIQVMVDVTSNLSLQIEEKKYIDF